MNVDHENCPLTDALMNTVDALVVILDREGRILQFNAACEAVTGYTADEVVGRPILDVLIPVEQRGDVGKIIDDLSTRGANRFENDWITAEGRRRRIMWSNASMGGSTGDVEAIVGTGIDITDQRLLESRIAQADRLETVGRLAAGIAHDFNNTLTSLCLRVERLAARDLDSDSRVDIEAIAKTIGRTQDLISELLSFSSPHFPEPVQLDVNAEIRRMSGIVGGLLGADVEVDLDLTSDPTTVLIDVVGFEQTLTNLIMNARAAMPRGGTVTIATAVEEIEAGAAPTVDVPSRLVPGSYVRLTVADTGTGIDPDDLPRVFDPYFTTRSSEKGTGLGLATVYATITRSRGAVNVSSDLGRGATFDVWLPVAGNGSGPRPTTKENGRGTVGHGDGTKR